MRYFLFFALFIQSILISCSNNSDYDPDFSVGNSFANSQLRVIQIDTLTLNTSTIKFDSLITSSSNRVLIGKYQDPEFGAVVSSSFFEVTPDSYDIDSEAVYDSLVIYLNYDNYYYNDTLQYNEIHVKRVIQTLKPNQDAFYNTSDVMYNDNDLGVYRYLPRPLEADTLYFKLNDELGHTLFDKIQTKNITTTDEFKNYFKGIALVPGANDNGSIIGFSNDAAVCKIRLYFSIAGETEMEQKYIDISIDKTAEYASYFNQIKAADPNEYLSSINNQEDDLDSKGAENRTFVQAGTGYATRIKFPSIKSLYDIPGKGTILEATLKIHPVIQSYNDLLALKDTLNLYVADQNNALISQLTYSDGSALQAILNRENQEFNTIYYQVPIGTYIEEIFTAESDSENAIVLLPNDYQSTVNRMVLNGFQGDDTMKLELIYTVYDEE